MSACPLRIPNVAKTYRITRSTLIDAQLRDVFSFQIVTVIWVVARYDRHIRPWAYLLDRAGPAEQSSPLLFAHC